MKRRILFLALTLTLCLGLSTPAFALAAVPTSSTVLIDGEARIFEAYTIDGYNYFKLRDLAYAFSGTEKQFAVSWDAASNAIQLTSGQPYTPVGGEMAVSGAGAQTASPDTPTVYADGIRLTLTAYNIGGYTYFKLRDIGEAIDFAVEWIEAYSTISIDTYAGYYDAYYRSIAYSVFTTPGFVSSAELTIGGRLFYETDTAFVESYFDGYAIDKTVRSTETGFHYTIYPEGASLSEKSFGVNVMTEGTDVIYVNYGGVSYREGAGMNIPPELQDINPEDTAKSVLTKLGIEGDALKFLLSQTYVDLRAFGYPTLTYGEWSTYGHVEQQTTDEDFSREYHFGWYFGDEDESLTAYVGLTLYFDRYGLLAKIAYSYDALND